MDYKAKHRELMTNPEARKAGMASLRSKLFAAHTRFASDKTLSAKVRADQQSRADFIREQQAKKGELEA